MRTFIASHHKLLAIIGIVALLAAFGVAGNTAATSLTITLTVVASPPPTTSPVHNLQAVTTTPFHKTITDLGMVHTVQTALNGAEEVSGHYGCDLLTQQYDYDLTFAVLGVTTQEYISGCDAVYWEPGGPFAITRLHDPANDVLSFYNVTIGGVDVMHYLHEQVGMPLPT